VLLVVLFVVLFVVLLAVLFVGGLMGAAESPRVRRSRC
jgi:hypothetical protein